MPEGILDIVAEDIEGPHVPDQVQPPAVEEHRDHRGQVPTRPSSGSARFPRQQGVRARMKAASTPQPRAEGDFVQGRSGDHHVDDELFVEQNRSRTGRHDEDSTSP